MLTIDELKEVHNNVMTIMENRIMKIAGCDRKTANSIANEVLELDRESEILLSNEITNACLCLSFVKEAETYQKWLQSDLRKKIDKNLEKNNGRII